MLTLDIERLAQARVAIDRAAFVAGLLLYIEPLCVLILFADERVNPGKLAAATAGLGLWAAQIVLVRPGLETLCRRIWRGYTFFAAAVLLLAIISAAAYAHSSREGGPGSDDVRILPIYSAALVAAFTYPISKGLLGLLAIRRELRNPGAAEMMARWLFRSRRVRARRSLDRGRMARALPWFLLAVVVLAAMFVPIVRNVRFPPAGALVIATALCIRGLRHLSMPAREVRAADSRPPVLILRAFKDDGLHARGAVFEKLWSRPATWFRTTSFEELVAQEYEAIGPAIIVGAPGERLPRLGAAREHLSNADWQTAVTGLIDDAAVIVIIAGDTDNLFWEFRTAASRRGHDRLVLMVPPLKPRPLRTRLHTFVEANRHLLNGLSAAALGQTMLAACSRDGVPIVIRSGRRRAWHYRLGIRLFVCIHSEGLLAGADVSRFVQTHVPALVEAT